MVPEAAIQVSAPVQSPVLVRKFVPSVTFNSTRSTPLGVPSGEDVPSADVPRIVDTAPAKPDAGSTMVTAGAWASTK